MEIKGNKNIKNNGIKHSIRRLIQWYRSQYCHVVLHYFWHKSNFLKVQQSIFINEIINITIVYEKIELYFKINKKKIHLKIKLN